MKRTITNFRNKLRMMTFASIMLLGTISAMGTNLINPSWSASTLAAGAAATYTFTYTITTPSPDIILYALNTNANFQLKGIATTTVTINGVPAAINNNDSFINAGYFWLIVRLVDPTLAVAGAKVVVTTEAINPTTGTYSWTWIQTANGGGQTIDGYDTPPAVTIGGPATALEDITNTAINIGPNPSKGIFTLKGDHIYSAKAINSAGVTVSEVTGNHGETVIDLTSQPNGIYLIQVSTAAGKEIKKVIKE